MICVVAGSLREFGRFIIERCHQANKFVMQPGGSLATIDGVQYLYVRDVESLRGLQSGQIIYIGSFLQRKDLIRIQEESLARGMRST